MGLGTMHFPRTKWNVPNSRKIWKQPVPRRSMPSKNGMPSVPRERKLYPNEFEPLKIDRELEPVCHQSKVKFIHIKNIFDLIFFYNSTNR